MISLGQKAFADMKDLLQKLNWEQEHEKAFENINKNTNHTIHTMVSGMPTPNIRINTVKTITEKSINICSTYQ